MNENPNNGKIYFQQVGTTHVVKHIDTQFIEDDET